jgi:hypothetical protein
MRILLPLLLAISLAAAQTPAKKPRPEYQYQSGDIQVSLPTADEPRVKAFGPESVKAALKYLEEGALCWVREKTCVNCHTTGPYLSERTAWTAQFGKPSEEVLADFIESVPKEVREVKETATKSGHRHYPGGLHQRLAQLGAGRVGPACHRQNLGAHRPLHP